MFDGIIPRSQKKAVELQDHFDASSYQHNPDRNYASVLIKGDTLPAENLQLPIGYELVEIEKSESGFLIRTKV